VVRTTWEISMSEVGVIFGGPSPEHDVSVLTGLQAARELAGTLGHTVHGLYWSLAGDWFEVAPTLEGGDFEDGVPATAQPLRLVVGPGGGFSVDAKRLGRTRPLDLDAVVVCCHGGPGEDGSLQGALDLAGVRYAGPSAAGAALGMDKLVFGAVVAAAGLPTLPRVLLTPDATDVGFPGPYIVKPRRGGSSIGVEVTHDLEAAKILLATSVHLAGGAVVEPYRADCFDLEVAVRSWPELEVSAIARPLRTKRAGGAAGEPEILGYADKYLGGEGMVSAPRELPALMADDLRESLVGAAATVSGVCDLRGVARIDFLSDGDQWMVNEINTIPGSLARYLWIDPVVSFSRLLGDMLDEALSRQSFRLISAGADGTVLRGASSIASKLA
jgi:D-alanine-D-alanine ligase